jgi:hypothetical protein
MDDTILSGYPRSRVDVTAASRLGGKVIERVVHDSGAGRTTFYLFFTDGTELGWSYTDGGTFIRRPGEQARDIY